jgi:hypothetical protein
MSKPRQWVVVYRIGGRERFEWRRTLPVLDRDEAMAQKGALETAGYFAYPPQDYEKSMVCGLPETFEQGDSL